MTTSCDTDENDNRLGKAEWEDDILAENEVQDLFGPDGHETVYWLIIQDTTEESAWIRSDETRDLSEMQ